MSFPWKKMKSKKISQFVTHYLHNSQKRCDGSSLVVETGFPTSLIDLFIENRENLRKSSKNINPDIHPIHVNETIIVPSAASGSEGNNVIGVVERNDVVRVERDRAIDANTAFLAVMKMFLIVVLGLGIEKLTVWITLFVFLLFFLDCAGKRVYGLFNPYSEAKLVLRLMANLLRSNEEKLDYTNDGVLMPEIKKVAESINIIDELEIVESEYDLVKEIQSRIRIVYDSGSEERRFENQETELKDMVMEKVEFLSEGGEMKRKKSKRDKMKSKIKKIMPKKRKFKNEEHHLKCLDIFSEDNDIALSGELEVDQCKDEGESEISSRLSSTSSGRYDENFIGLSEVIRKVVTERKEGEKTEYVPIWRYLVLCLIVLIGLVEGRAFALLLTLSWFLVLKFYVILDSFVHRSLDF